MTHQFRVHLCEAPQVHVSCVSMTHYPDICPLSGQPAAVHHDIIKYHQSTSTVHPEVLNNLTVQQGQL